MLVLAKWTVGTWNLLQLKDKADRTVVTAIYIWENVRVVHLVSDAFRDKEVVKPPSCHFYISQMGREAKNIKEDKSYHEQSGKPFLKEQVDKECEVGIIL